MSENILRQKTVVVEISGVSTKSKDDAVTTAFRNLKSQIAKAVPELIIYMRPVEVELVDIQTEKYTEKFLLLFMPREREKVKLTLKVRVDVSYLTI
ncbi:MAG: DUF4312 family protein [Erysipelotrichia bacterium]|nr:DUF4312 family protein [Erysipelotrichia bacterium]